MSPRDRFQQHDGLAKEFDRIVSTDVFEQGADAALLQLTDGLTGGGNDQVSAVANHFRLDGAKRFLAILLTLSKKQVIPTPRDLDNLQPEKK